MRQTQTVENPQIYSNNMSNQNEIVAPLSVYIPRVFNNISADRIAQVFQNLRLGRVHHVDFVPRVDDNEAKMAFVHFEYWNTNNVACEHLIERIQDPQREARVVYEDPYYWLLLPNHNDSTSNMYNSYNMRREINQLNNTVENLRREFNNVNNVLDTLLADFYDIANNSPHSHNISTPVSGIENLRKEQKQLQKCSVCYVLLPSDVTQCPACQAPMDADEKLLKVLTTRPKSMLMKDIDATGTNALNNINDFVKSKINNNSQVQESTKQGWVESWFGN